ncbi:MAG: hypothetical protein ACXWQO_03050 [Bdellovibrionota bacterium]
MPNLIEWVLSLGLVCRNRFQDVGAFGISLILVLICSAAVSIPLRADEPSKMSSQEAKVPARETRTLQPVLPVDEPGGSVLLRDKNNNPLQFDQAGAARACAGKNLRLPGIRELAQFAQDHGAVGVADGIGSSGQGHSPRLIRAVNSDGKKFEFYYSSEGYHDEIPEPYLGLKHPQYWSSSENLDGANASFYVLDVKGRIHDHYKYVKGYARCFK